MGERKKIDKEIGKIEKELEDYQTGVTPNVAI